MDTRSKTRTKIVEPSVEGNEGAVEDSNLQIATSDALSRHSKSKCGSKGSSTHRKRILEAQVQADMDLALLMEKQFEFNRQMVLNRLALEKSKIDEEFELNEEVRDDTYIGTEPPKEINDKVREWLQEQQKGNIEDTHNGIKNDNGPLGEKLKCQTIADSCDSVKRVRNNSENIVVDDIKQLMARQIVDKDLPNFSGEFKEWPGFYQHYLSTTKLLQLSDQENIYRLRKALKGEARRAVEGLLIAAFSAESVIDILKRKYGRPDLIIVRSLVNEVKTLPPVKTNDFNSLTHFAEVISNMVITTKSLGMKNYLECPQLLDELLLKLPPNMQLSWGERMADRSGKLTLIDFKEWMWKKSEAANFAQSISLCSNMSHTMRYKEKYKSSLVTVNKEVNCKRVCLLCKEEHCLQECKMFSELPIDEKWNFLKTNGYCYSCLKRSHKIRRCFLKKKCGIDGCEKHHHKLLHSESIAPKMFVSTIKNDISQEEIVAHTTEHYQGEVLLKVALVTIRTSTQEKGIYALFDEASTVTLLDESIANEMNLIGEETKLGLKWTDHSCKRIITRKVAFQIADKDKSMFYKLNNVYTMKDLDLPTQTIDSRKMKDKWVHLRQVKFENMINVKPQLLIGQDSCDLIVTRKIIEGPKNSPVLSYTKLGWIVHGNLREFKGRVYDMPVFHLRHRNDEELENMVKKFFEMESYGVKMLVKKVISKDDKRAEEIMEQTTRRTEDRWETGLIWKEGITSLPDSKPLALQRLQYVERRMSKDPEFSKAYKEKIEDYLRKGYAKKVSEEDDCPRKWYLPHFAVVNPNKPGKIRFVMDAAAKVEGKSLNDFLLKGPDLYNSLVGTIWKFREKPIAFSADIREMFHQVKIIQEDRSALRFLWRDKDSQEPNTYEMQVMIFGAVSSPYSAQYVKNKNALEFRDLYPQAVDAIVQRHYMDDYLDSVYTVEGAIELVNQVITIHKKGGFDLRGWVCNSKEVLDNIPEEFRNDCKLLEETQTSQRILGLKWNSAEDNLLFPLNINKVEKNILNGEKIPTKRDVLKVVMSIFDPLGMLSPFTIKGKILLQEIWKSGITWDQQINTLQVKKWRNWLKDLEEITQLKVPRCYSLQHTEKDDLQLHIFSDTSEQACGTAGYFRFKNSENIQTSLVVAKTKVPPLKLVTIPRLELQAAVMAIRLAKTIKEHHTLQINKTFFWTDSKIVLHWIKSNKIKYKTYVAHRISEINEFSEPDQWNWIPSNLNISDVITRDKKLTMLFSDSQWFKGPSFLYSGEDSWPKECVEVTEGISEATLQQPDLLELKQKQVTLHITVEGITYLPKIERFSKFTKLIRSTAYMLRSCENFKRKGENLIFGELTCEEIEKGEMLWYRKAQTDSFSKEIYMLRKGQAVCQDSKLHQLSPYLEKGVIRLKGRIHSPEIPYEMKYPIILHNKHPFTKLVVEYYHVIKTVHGGIQIMLNELRQKYWILQMRKTVTRILKQCILCSKRRAKPNFPEMGQLPDIRTDRPPKPFTYVGMDYFGPMEITVGRRIEKRYGVLFTCLSVRAIHIEIAETLSTDSALMAIRRFISRRGWCDTIWSDNGTNLTSAAKELRKSLQELDKDKIEREITEKKINWRFIPPTSPHMGGAWERLIRSAKEALRIILKEQRPRLEVLQTALHEAEHVINSRPLAYVSSDLNDLESLTPNHFLIGYSSINMPPVPLQDVKINLRKSWKMSQQLADCFWNSRIKEYLPTLNRRTKWLQQKDNLKEGNSVVVMDSRLPRNSWPLGRIIKTYPGRDGIVRVADVKTKSGTFRRPATKLCPIEALEFGAGEMLELESSDEAK